MSRYDNINALEKQLADLQMTKDLNTSGKLKKIPPAVPPKKKAMISTSTSAVAAAVSCEPYFREPVLEHNRTNNTNALSTFVQPQYNDYANLNLSDNQSSDKISKSFKTPTKTVYSNPEEYSPITLQLQNLTPEEIDNKKEHYLPPSSPVSSNYSELARATNNMNFCQDRRGYPPIYQNEIGYAVQPSTYESLYEPIEPANQLTGSFESFNTNGDKSSNVQNFNKQLPKEAEVDALTDLLVQSITNSQDIDFFGICVKCNEKVMGENSGCTAMGNMYHISCFCCYRCNINLHGKRLYAVEGQPYCEEDYYETLEKCTVCNKPILDRILRATGNPYHRTCFTCVVCNKSLDGVPFTVDAMNRIHCIEDFHKKFAPRCCVCELPIMPEEGEEETVRVVALDRSFHVSCYRCEDCGLLLSSEELGRGCYPLDDHILCKNCNAYRIQLLSNVITTDL